jgi:hypothetical protein
LIVIVSVGIAAIEEVHQGVCVCIIQKRDSRIKPIPAFQHLGGGETDSAENSPEKTLLKRVRCTSRWLLTKN